jgi:hypothetical protein
MITESENSEVRANIVEISKIFFMAVPFCLLLMIVKICVEFVLTV